MLPKFYRLGGVISLKFSKNSNYLAAGFELGALKLISTSSYREKASILIEGEGAILQIAWIDKAQLLISNTLGQIHLLKLEFNFVGMASLGAKRLLNKPECMVYDIKLLEQASGMNFALIEQIETKKIVAICDTERVSVIQILPRPMVVCKFPRPGYVGEEDIPCLS